MNYVRVFGLMLFTALCLVGFQNCSGYQPSSLGGSSSSGLSSVGQSGASPVGTLPGQSGNLPVGTSPGSSPGQTPSVNLDQSLTCATKTTQNYTMAIQSPCSPNVVTINQKTSPAPMGIALSDANALLTPTAMPIKISAPGMGNVEVWSHGARVLSLTGTNGTFTGTLDLSKEPAGPLHVRILAWDSAPGVNAYTVQLKAEMTVFISGSRLPMPTSPAGASGMTLKWSDRFTKLSSAACNPGTGVWPNCTIATASGSGATWWENTPGGGDFGDAAFEHSDGAYNPFAILPTGGILRIRATYNPSYVDPYGYKRSWSAGMLATAFGRSLPYTTNTPLMTDGYYEARLLAPNSSAGQPWSGKAGGTWPAFWQVSYNSTPASGAIELDATELYGEDPGYQQSATHAYSPATAPPPNTGGQYIYHADPGPDLTADFHRFGLLVQGSATANGTVCNYLDDVKLACAPMPVFANGVTPQWYFMLNLAMGAGWPTNVPPSNQYDMFVDYVAAWTK